MTRPVIEPNGKELLWDKNDIIVSKTNTKGIITYANKVFQSVSGYSEEELIGASHNIVRHPDMPRCVFKLLWDKISQGHEVFAYVVNLAKKGGHYWVLAHVTPSFDENGNIVAYHSNRRLPERDAVDVCAGLYKTLLDIEENSNSPKEGILTAEATLVSVLEDKKMTYEEFVLTL